MKTIIIHSLVGTGLLLLNSCSTPKPSSPSNQKQSVRVYHEGFQPVWRAVLESAGRGDLEILDADPERGFVLAKRGLHTTSFNDNVGIRVRPINAESTRVEISSRQDSPPTPWGTTWEQEVLNAVAARLGTAAGRSVTPVRQIDAQQTSQSATGGLSTPLGELRDSGSQPARETSESGTGGVGAPRGQLRDAGSQSAPPPVNTEPAPSAEELLRRERVRLEQEEKRQQAQRDEQLRREQEYLQQQRRLQGGRAQQ